MRTQVLATMFLVVFEVFGTEALRTHQPSFWVLAILAYGLGWLGLSFVAFIHKILPFLVWMHRYAHSGGSSKRPRLDDIWGPKTVYLPARASARLARAGGGSCVSTAARWHYRMGVSPQ